MALSPTGIKKPKCQGAAARDWLEDRKAELLPVGYFHLGFTLPEEIASLAYANKRVLYGLVFASRSGCRPPRLLFKASVETVLTIAADPKHLGAKPAIMSVLHTWGSAIMHHPHVHMIVTGGGLSSDGNAWVSSRKKFFLPVQVLSRLFRRRFLEMLAKAHDKGRLTFQGRHIGLADPQTFATWLAPLRKSEWVVYAEPPFGGPDAVLTYLSHYTHRVAISNRRFIRADVKSVTFRIKDYRIDGPERYTTMTLGTAEFIRRFLRHVLPKGFHRIRHYGLLTNGSRAANIARACDLLNVKDDNPECVNEAEVRPPDISPHPCPRCGSNMRIVEAFDRGYEPAHRPAPRGPP